MTTATIETLDHRLERIENIDIPELYGRMNTLTASNLAKLKSIEDTLGNIQTSIENLGKGLNGRMDNLEKGLNAKIEGLDMKIDGVNKKVEGLDMKVDGIHSSLSSQVASIKWFFMASIASVAVLGTYLTIIIK